MFCPAERGGGRRGIAEACDGVPNPAEQNTRVIASQEMTGTKEMVARGKQRCG